MQELAPIDTDRNSVSALKTAISTVSASLVFSQFSMTFGEDSVSAKKVPRFRGVPKVHTALTLCASNLEYLTMQAAKT